MPNYSARQMLAQLPLRRAQGGPVYMAEGGAAADQAVLSFISANPNASLEAIATQITNTGADLNNVAAALNIPADVAQSAFAKADANNQALLAAEARIMSEMDTAGAQWNAAQAYNEVLKSGVTTQQALDAGVKPESIDRIFSTDQPITTADIAATSGRPSSFGTSAAFAGQDLPTISQNAQAYVAGLMDDGVITPEERRQTRDFAIKEGVTLQDMAAAGVDPNLLFDTSAADARRAEEARLAEEKAAAEKAAAEKAAADKAAADKAAAESAAAAKAAADKAAADKANADAAAAAKAAAEKAAADKAAADKAAADKAAADKAIADKAAADKAAADKAAADKAAADKALSDEERAAAAAAAADSARIAAEAKAAADKKAFDDRVAAEVTRILGEQEAARLKALADKMGAAASGVDVEGVAATVGAVTTEDIVSAVSGNDLTNLGLDNTPSTTPIAGTTTTPVDTTGTSGTSTFLETYVAPTATVFPTYVADTVYQQLPDPASIYAEGETALDTEFRASAPRTASYNPQTGAFQGYDYTTAAKLMPATGSGMSFTPPSVTSRPRQLLSAAASQPGLSASQRFARARQAQQANLMQAFRDTGAKRNSANYYDWMNQIRSGMFNNAAGQFDNQLFLNAFNPWAASQTSTGAGTTTTGDALAAADPYTVNAVDLNNFTGFDNFNAYSGLGNSNQTFDTEVDAEGRPFAGGGYVKKPRGFADGGPADSMTAEELTAQLMAMDSAAAAQAPRPTDQAQTESRSLLENILSGAKQIPSTVYEYGKDVVQSQSPSAKLLADIYGAGKTMQAGAADDPVGYALDMAPVTGEIRSGMDVEKYSDLANEARAAGDTDLAEMYEQVVLMSVAGAAPLLGMGARGTKKAAVTTALKAADRAAAGRKAQKLIESQPTVKASEALGQLMEQGFRRTSTTQADRTRVGGGNIGGAAFSAISEADPNYAGKVWGVMDSGTASRLTNLTSPETAWTTMLGSATQLKTNPLVFDKLKKGFVDSMKAGNLSPELAEKININLAVTFGEGADIRDPKIWAQADTFEKRAALADIMMGQGLPPSKGGISLGGEKSGKGVIFKPTEILIKETEKALLHPIHGGDAPTFAAGPRLFSLDGTAEYRPDLHPGFPTLLGGGDLGVSMQPTPTEVYLPDWHRQFKADNPSRKGPGYYDLALGVKGKGLPSQELTDEYIRHLLREGFSEGGEVKKPKGSASSDLEELGKYAGGGLIEKAIQKGAEALGFDDERQVAISQEAVDLTNQMVDSGLIGEQYRVELLLPEDASKRTRQNTGIKGDEEVFNAVNHALFAYDAGQNRLSAVGAQAKEIYQGLNKKMGGSDPRSEYLDYFNNKFGFNLAKQGLSRQEAKNAIMDTLGNINNQGTRGRMMKGEPVKAGTDLLTNVEDAKYPWE